MSDLISRLDAITIPVMPKEYRQYQTMNIDDAYERGWHDLQDCIEELPSAEPPYQYSEAYVEQIRGERDILQDMVNNMAEPETEMVLCALADRTCPFQGKEYAWCLTCPHISDEDRDLVKKAVSKPKTGRWVRKTKEINDCDGNRAYYWYECDNCGARPPKDQWGHEWHSDFCPNCGSRNIEGGQE